MGVEGDGDGESLGGDGAFGCDGLDCEVVYGVEGSDNNQEGADR